MIPTRVKMMVFIKSAFQISGCFIKCIQTRNTVEATTSSRDIKYGLSIMNKGVISRNVINVIAGAFGLFDVIKQPNKSKTDIDK